VAALFPEADSGHVHPQQSSSGAGPAERTRMAQHYRDSSRHELLFWEAALKREKWPV
jgi:hypothetical protein